MERVEVLWKDAFGDVDAWISLEDLASSPRYITTIGWEIKGANAGHLVIAGSYDPETNSCAHVIHIPKEMVKERTVLK